jgi:hypothetical protein
MSLYFHVELFKFTNKLKRVSVHTIPKKEVSTHPKSFFFVFPPFLYYLFNIYYYIYIILLYYILLLYYKKGLGKKLKNSTMSQTFLFGIVI